MSNIAKIQAKARRDVHRGMSVAASHIDGATGTRTDGISVRWHRKMALPGDIQDSGYAAVIEGSNRVVFNREELAAISLTLKPGDKVEITDYGYNNAIVTLVEQEEIIGPVDVTWWATL